MKLFTIQDKAVVDQLSTEYFAEWEFVDDYFKPAYEWYVEQVKYQKPPVWCSDHALDKYELSGYYEYAVQEKKELYEIELDVPDDLVIKSDFDYWHAVLGKWEIAEDNENITMEDSWTRIFDENFTLAEDKDWVKNYQYTISSIKPEYIVSIKKVTTGPTYYLIKLLHNWRN